MLAMEINEELNMDARGILKFVSGSLVGFSRIYHQVRDFRLW